jgi:hypothetical protein
MTVERRFFRKPLAAASVLPPAVANSLQLALRQVVLLAFQSHKCAAFATSTKQLCLHQKALLMRTLAMKGQ